MFFFIIKIAMKEQNLFNIPLHWSLSQDKFLVAHKPIGLGSWVNSLGS